MVARAMASIVLLLVVGRASFPSLPRHLRSMLPSVLRGSSLRRSSHIFHFSGCLSSCALLFRCAPAVRVRVPVKVWAAEFIDIWALGRVLEPLSRI